MKDLQQYYKEHESRYSEDKIRTRGREDGTRNVPDASLDECSPYEMELMHACARLGSKVAGAYRAQLEEIDAKIKAERDHIERLLEDSTTRAENIYAARKAALDDNHELQDARKHLEVAENRYNMMHTKLGRAPIEYCPHWLYVIFAFLIFAGEIPLNAIVFQIFGEAQVMTWIMAFVVGLAVPVSAHFIGIKSREHQGRFSWPNAFKAFAVFAVVVGALYGLSVMRQTYLGEFKEELGLTDTLVQSSILFFWLNVAVLCAAIIVAYLAHDPVPGYQKLEADYQHSYHR